VLLAPALDSGLQVQLPWSPLCASRDAAGSHVAFMTAGGVSAVQILKRVLRMRSCGQLHAARMQNRVPTSFVQQC
jgi:hypothetical protein